MSWTEALALLAYASVLLELTCFPIPSEASTWQLLTRTPGAGGEALLRARARSLRGRTVRYLLPTTLCVAMFLVPLASVAWPAAFAPWRVAWPWSIAILGAIAIVAGRALTFVSVLQLRARRRDPGAGLGLFRWSRNPGLLGMYLLFVGLCTVLGLPLLWLGLPVYIGNMHVRVRLEEAHQHSRDPEGWQAYAARVPRYLPLPGLR
jgi:protein-S-isoprenylcysteine O-methyltransferase Ste14